VVLGEAVRTVRFAATFALGLGEGETGWGLAEFVHGGIVSQLEEGKIKASVAALVTPVTL
jgi:hypothetical protein